MEDRAPVSITARVYALYGLSGLVSLGYQVAWFRIYVDQFGATNLTFALVLCNFIGGLGAGALASRPLSGWLARRLALSDPLRVYGVVEILVGLTALLALLGRLIPADAFGPFPYVLDDGIYVQAAVYRATRLAVTIACVFVPCFLMGVTFPLLCDAFRHDARFPSRLYAWNTLGACSGVLLCQFVLLLVVGHDLTLVTMAALNVLLGAFFVATGGAPAPAERAGAGEPAPVPGAAGERLPTLLVCAIVSGLLAGALEGDMFRRLKFFGYATPAAMSFASFWAILGIFLASWTVSAAHALRLVHVKIAYAAALAIYASVVHFAHPLHTWVLSLVSEGPPRFQFMFPTSASEIFLYVGIFIFPAFYLIALLLPYVCNRVQAGRRHLGIAYGANTLAFCIGVFAFSWVAPAVSVFYSMKLVMVVLGVGVGLLFLVSETRRLEPWKPATAAVLLLAGCALTPAAFDASYMSPGFRKQAAQLQVRGVRSNGAATTYVVRLPRPRGHELLFFDNVSLSNTSMANQRYMRLMAHFPLLAQSEPRSALLICFGVGNTASAIADHEVLERIDVADVNDNVLRTAPEFARTTRDVHLDPRVRMLHDDGRNFLNLTDQRYDLITSEPPPPLYDGVHRLYSREYYETALERLTEDGMMSQWVPIWQLPPEAGELIIATFVSVFPHTLIFTGMSDNLVILGSRKEIDLARVEEQIRARPRVAADLRRMGMGSPVSLFARVMQGDRQLRRTYGGGRVISDQLNQMVNLYTDPTPGAAAAVAYDPEQMLADVGAGRLAVAGELRRVVRDRKLLLEHVPDFPRYSLGSPASSPRGRRRP